MAWISCSTPFTAIPPHNSLYFCTLEHQKMSAPNSGRQSPPPERQTGAQQQDPVASGHTQHGIHGGSKGASEDTKFHGLSSNPKHILEDIEAKKFSKGPGN
ncbi:hypothetical protein ABOM_011108 [Aspergillus bombycis]|uniref:Uncharacterized protein n=1 Tax=Aspergillus bombycis TaxID=109264 RepID=A0A1F7ZL99_9EURO|nr:hypothetical protein ABOM_011108 [Aspergillus bombycis]OGM40233.1 hypothetical protein ABOM_011108 [Aspergillus bombycis]